jgi:two-component system, NtrC family, response regulator HydG
MPKLLIIDDDATFCLMLKTFLSKKGYDVDVAFSFSEGLRHIRSAEYQVVLSDIRLPDRNGLEILKEIHGLRTKCQVVLMTGYGDIRTAVNAIKMGAFEYVTKPVNPDEVLHTISMAINELGHRKVSKKLEFINGTCLASQKMNEYISLVAPTDMSVVIIGDSGTGKEYVARKIHQESLRVNAPFIAMDCGALSRELATSEFFGHVKGAFTGAVADKTGHFVEANKGTLFLDEIGNLTYDVQVQLLRAIQERKVKPLGSNKIIDVDVRIIVATNEDLWQAVHKGDFREDLYHRLNEFSILMPRLCEREGDLMIFAEYFLKMANEELNREVKNFSPEVIDIFQTYAWPGNIRELKNVIKRAVLLSKSNALALESLPHELANFKSMENSGGNGNDLKDLKEKIEYQRIIAVLEKTKYNKSKAAQILNIDRKTLYNKMKQFDIE